MAPTPTKHSIAALAAYGLSAALLGSWVALPHFEANTNAHNDELGYLDVAGHIHRDYPGHHFPAAMFDGRYTEANRGPLYPFVLSWFLRGTYEDFATVKVVNWVLGLLVLNGLFWTLWWVTHRVRISLFVTGLLAANRAFAVAWSTVSCEPLLILFVAQFLFLLIASFHGRSWLFVPACAALGLGYLTKASAAFLAPLVLLPLILPSSWRVSTRRRALTLLAGWAALAMITLPLTWRNQVVYHHPMYNWNAALMWNDSDVAQYTVRFQEQGADWRRYVEAHTWTDFRNRMADGLTRYYHKAATLFPFAYHPLLGKVMFAVALIGAVVTQPLATRVVFYWSFAVFTLFFAWYAVIATGTRFILPLYPLLFFFLYAGIKRVARWVTVLAAADSAWAARWAERLRGRLGTVASVGGLGALVLLALLARERLTRQDVESPERIALHRWVSAHVGEGEKVLLGDESGLAFGYYRSFGDVEIDPAPRDVNLPGLIDHMRRNGYRYLVVTRGVQRHLRLPGIEWTPRAGLVLVEASQTDPPRLGELVLVARDESGPTVDYLIYELPESPSASNTGVSDPV